MRCATRDSFVVEPQNHLVAGFVKFGPQNSVVRFWQESKEAHGVVTKVASRQSNFVWSVWPSNKNPRSWSILPSVNWMSSMYVGVV
jgi:hypothetical protein